MKPLKTPLEMALNEKPVSNATCEREILLPYIMLVAFLIQSDLSQKLTADILEKS